MLTDVIPNKLMRGERLQKVAHMGILVVDDEAIYLAMILELLRAIGYQHVYGVSSGVEALQLIEDETIDVVLSDVNMPGMDGIALLKRMKAQSSIASIPVILMSGVDEIDTVIESIELGAEDYLHKPIKEALLWARVQATLERKFLRDQERRLFCEIEEEKKKSEEILYNLIPEGIAARLRQGEENIAEVISECTVMFSDVVGFTSLSTKLDPAYLVQMINTIFHAFDRLIDIYQLEKIKTNGDNYIVVGGLDPNSEQHASRCVGFAMQAIEAIQDYNKHTGMELAMRIGLSSGPVVAGVVGKTRFSFDLWGDTVNIASRMESAGVPNRVHISNATKLLLSNEYDYTSRGEIDIKGKGPMETFLVDRRG